VHALADPDGKKVYQQVMSNAFRPVGSLCPPPAQTHRNTSTTEMPIYTSEELASITIAEMRNICHKWNIKQGKKKQQYIDNIVKRSETLHRHMSEVEQIQKAILKGSLPDPSPTHNFYRDWFNCVDMSNRRWYSVEECHAHYSWKTKMLLTILRFGIMNLWTSYLSKKFYTFLSFRTELAERMRQYE
jgi:hypothetical protein